MTSQLTATFLGGSEGRVFALLHRPRNASTRGCVLVAPPFAEEMNKTRKLFTELGHSLAERGIGFALVDLFGTGDSDGDFVDADWDRWMRDLQSCAAWCEAQGCRVRGVLGVRMGCMLAAETARVLPGLETTVFWQPVLEGSRMVDQFLRLRVAAGMMEGVKESTASLRQRLAAGETIEVAGYGLSGRLVAQLDRARLEDRLGPHLGATAWFEVLRSADSSPPQSAVDVADKARAAGMQLDAETVVGEPFWSSVEIVTNAELLSRSAEFFQRALARGASGGSWKAGP